MQCAYNVTLRHFCLTIFAVEKHYYVILRAFDYIVTISFGYILQCVCFNLYCGGFILFCNACVCVCARVCVCVCVRVCVCVGRGGVVMCVFVWVL